MINPNEPLSAFAIAAGTSTANLSLVIRTILCAIFFLWSAWNIHGQFKLVQNGELDIHDVPFTILRILLLCSLIVFLVFVA